MISYKVQTTSFKKGTRIKIPIRIATGFGPELSFKGQFAVQINY